MTSNRLRMFYSGNVKRGTKMKKKTRNIGIAFGVSIALSISAAAITNDWENLAVNSANRLRPRTYSMPLASEADAFIDALEPDSPYRLSLNGTWKISWAGNPDLRVRDFFRKDFDDSDWFEIDVPSCVEMRGFGSPGYTNVRYPHKLEWPLIRDRQSGRADYNPVSSYRRTFTVPESWKGRRVILRFDGVYSAYYVWVNGRKVGYAEDSKLPSEFDITPYLNHPSESNNSLAVEVYRWCDGSYLEDQDMTRFSGIFRDVTLWSMPKDGIWDFAVKTGISPQSRRAAEDAESATWEISVDGIDGEWSATLYDAARNPVSRLSSNVPSPVRILRPRLWSAEKPYLYTLVVKKGSDIRVRKVGFKDVRISGHTLFVNGRPIKLKGVNRHETNPENGRTVSLDDMLADIRLMKRYNIDTVRTSHYPDHHLWYDLCDRYGIYVIAEANVEGHEPSWGEKALGRFPEFGHSIVERNVRNALFYRNHPSVAMWSMGNETGHGDCFRHAIAEVKKIDSTRPVHWERGNKDADIDGRMYPSIEWLELRGKLGDGPTGLPVPGRGKGDSTPKDNSSGKVFFITEYAHAMGNSIGNFAEYWDVIYSHESLSGGCIWDWVDQAVWKSTGEVGGDGKPVRHLAYGGDWDEQPNDGPFNCNGVVDPFRRVTAKLVEVGHVHRNLVVRDDLTLENRFGFTWADEFDGEWELVENGVVVKRGTFAVPHVAPLSSGKLDLPRFEAKPGVESFLNVDFALKNDTLWAKKGWKVSRNQIRLSPQVAPETGVVGAMVKVADVDDGAAVEVVAGGTKAVFSRETGTLSELVMDGKTILKDAARGVAAGPKLTCERAFTDNDIWLSGGSKLDNPGSFVMSGLSQLRYHARPIKVDAEKGVVRTCVEVTGSKSAGFTHESIWTFAADGAVSVENVVIPHGTMPAALPRLGLSLRLDKSLENVKWYGRGPRENYVDRCTGSFFGVWSSTVDGLFEPYVRPQDNGCRSDVRWVELADGEGKGVRFAASEPMFVQAMHYSIDDLVFSRHLNGQRRSFHPLVRRDDVRLNLDIRQLGLGGASCGPRPMDKYIFPVKPERWTLLVTAVR